MHTWTPAQLAQQLQDKTQTFQLLDVREPWEYDIACLEGAKLIPLNQLQQNIHQLNPTQTVVVICHHGIRSAHACYFLASQGFDVINLSGGIDQWAREIDPNMSLY